MCIVYMVYMALTTAETLCIRSEDSLVSASVRGVYRFSYIRRLLKTQDDGIEPIAFNGGA